MNIYETVEDFYRHYAGEKRVYGRSAEGRPLYALFMGTHTPPVGISQYAIHGREWVTTLLAFAHLERGISCGGVWVLPLTNPDGALLSEIGVSSLPAQRRETLRALNGGREDFSLWKANAEGVDLNVNFDARWGTGAQNVFAPASENYVGRAPLCAPESRALWDFTLSVLPDFTVSWHTMGEEIYWRFHQPPLRAMRDKKIAYVLQKSVQYPLKEAKNSAGGYKDMCIEKLKIPAFTVECGRGVHPLGRETLPELEKMCGSALSALTEYFAEKKKWT